MDRQKAKEPQIILVALVVKTQLPAQGFHPPIIRNFTPPSCFRPTRTCVYLILIHMSDRLSVLVGLSAIVVYAVKFTPIIFSIIMHHRETGSLNGVDGSNIEFTWSDNSNKSSVCKLFAKWGHKVSFC